MAVAKRRAVDAFRRDKMRERKHEEIARTLDETFDGAAETIEAAMDDDLGDELLGLIFTACHPILSRRKASTARRLATAISQAPGLAGTPVLGHSDRATTSASCASSSARSTFRTMRARPAMSLARSMRKVASIAWCVSPAVTPHFRPRPQGRQAGGS